MLYYSKQVSLEYGFCFSKIYTRKYNRERVWPTCLEIRFHNFGFPLVPFGTVVVRPWRIDLRRCRSTVMLVRKRFGIVGTQHENRRTVVQVLVGTDAHHSVAIAVVLHLVLASFEHDKHDQNAYEKGGCSGQNEHDRLEGVLRNAGRLLWYWEIGSDFVRETRLGDVRYQSTVVHDKDVITDHFLDSEGVIYLVVLDEVEAEHYTAVAVFVNSIVVEDATDQREQIVPEHLVQACCRTFLKVLWNCPEFPPEVHLKT